MRNRKGELNVQQLKLVRPDYFLCDENAERMTQTMAYNFLPGSPQDGDTETLINRMIDAGVWDVPRLCACYDALEKEGLLEKPLGEPRNLTERERLLGLARLAAKDILKTKTGRKR